MPCQFCINSAQKNYFKSLYNTPIIEKLLFAKRGSLLWSFHFSASKAAFDLTGSLIPDVYPEGDPSLYALPVFLEEPKDQFTAKGNPAVLECKVAHAIKVNFVCNDEVVGSTSEEHLVDPETSIRFTKISLEVKRSDAMDVLGKFVCKCRAASNKGEVDSRDASVSVACEFFTFYFV